ncbi:hypothetical protein OHB26_16400 [Nocardia sp. NBC_01503]|uniref:hypothetical protein n=1 Tax=Nocardia sp. NBC_01503 TaxID=2975997 RepID=UPI002E7B791C|nr:hypothetical protein [Nocardia sp. NBC_01503]WTL35632.1 hypothetical protein OHB26_16400 [Nocardia sp. NBC_01503]
MTVREHDRIDHLATAPDGRLLLAMTEDRDYARGPDTVLNEDFRRKLNAYIGAVRSGDVARMAKDAGIAMAKGVEIVLFSVAEPTSLVFEMIGIANANLLREGISVRWESLAEEEIGPEVYERAIVDEAARLLGQGWKFAVLWVSLVGHEGSGGIQVPRADDSLADVELSDTLWGLLCEYKYVTSSEGAGAWLSGQISLAEPDQYKASFSWDTVPEWLAMPGAVDIRQELADYPRAADVIPAWMRAQLG